MPIMTDMLAVARPEDTGYETLTTTRNHIAFLKALRTDWLQKHRDSSIYGTSDFADLNREITRFEDILATI